MAKSICKVTPASTNFQSMCLRLLLKMKQMKMREARPRAPRRNSIGNSLEQDEKNIAKMKTSAKRFVEPCLQLKIFSWYFNNDYNKFLMLGVNPELRLIHKVNSRLQMLVSAGIVYNALLHYERKTNEEVGFPKDWQPSFSLQVC